MSLNNILFSIFSVVSYIFIGNLQPFMKTDLQIVIEIIVAFIALSIKVMINYFFIKLFGSKCYDGNGEFLKQVSKCYERLEVLALLISICCIFLIVNIIFV